MCCPQPHFFLEFWGHANVSTLFLFFAKFFLWLNWQYGSDTFEPYWNDKSSPKQLCLLKKRGLNFENFYWHHGIVFKNIYYEGLHGECDMTCTIWHINTKKSNLYIFSSHILILLYEFHWSSMKNSLIYSLIHSLKNYNLRVDNAVMTKGLKVLAKRRVCKAQDWRAQCL